MPKVLAFLAVLSVGVGILVWKAPHLELAAQVMSGQIDGRRIPVTDFVPARFTEEGVSVRVGALAFEAPKRARVERSPFDELFGLMLELDGLKCRVLPPRSETEEDGPWDLSGAPGQDEISRQTAICAASGRDLSFWMSAPEARALQEQLEIRPAYCLSAERVETIRGTTLCGLVLTQRVEGMPRLIFTYFSPDNRIRGRAFLYLSSDSAEAMHEARALVSTFTLCPEALVRSDAEPSWNRP